MKQLVNNLFASELNTSGKKVELVTRGFGAFELKMDIIASSEEQKAKIENDYQKMLAIHAIADPLLIEDHKNIDDIKKLPALSMGNILAYILLKIKKWLTRTRLGAVKIKKDFLIGIVDS